MEKIKPAKVVNGKFYVQFKKFGKQNFFICIQVFFEEVYCVYCYNTIKQMFQIVLLKLWNAFDGLWFFWCYNEFSQLKKLMMELESYF